MQLKVGFRSMFPRDTDLISFLLLKERGDFDTYWITLGQRARSPFNQIQQLFFFFKSSISGTLLQSPSNSCSLQHAGSVAFTSPKTGGIWTQ